MKANADIYFTNGRYNPYKSEQRRQQIKQQHSTSRFTPRGIHPGEYLRQQVLRGVEATHRLMTVVLTGSLH